MFDYVPAPLAKLKFCLIFSIFTQDGPNFDGKAYNKIPLSVLLPPGTLSQKYRVAEAIIIDEEE